MTIQQTPKTLWTSQDIVEATGGDVSAPFEAAGVSIDTRTLEQGDIYVALKGDHLDGHDFVAQAFEAGAAAALVEKGYTAKDSAWPLLQVEDTLDALWKLGAAGRARCTAKVIGVTGSAGKTGTKEMLAAALSTTGRTHASLKSYNNHWGVPLTLANMPSDTEYGVIEMGMNHAGELSKLTVMVKPHVALITTIEPVHVEHFESVEGIADAKAEIFESMDADGVAILNLDIPQFQRLEKAAVKAGLKNIISFGEDEEAKACLVDCTLHSDSSKVTADIDGVRVKYKLGVPGKHIVLNSLAALAAVQIVGGNLDQSLAALKKASPATGRGNRFEVIVETGKAPIVVIDESYNANPASMEAAFGVFEMVEPAEGGRRMAVLGDMLELGPEGPRMHAELANVVLKAKTDLVFCCGPQMDALYQVLPEDWHGAYAHESKTLAESVAAAIKPGDVVLVKGSLGSKMAYVIEALRAADVTMREKRHAV